MLYCLIFLSMILSIVTGQNCPTQYNLVKAGDGYYIASVFKKTMQGPSPTEILYDGGDIFYKIDNMTFGLYKKSDKAVLLRYKLNFKRSVKNYVDSHGNKISKKNIALQVTKSKPTRTLKVLTEFGSTIGDMAVDKDKDRVFFIGRDLGSSDQESGRLFAFDVATTDDVAGKIYANPVDIGNDIVAISVDSSTGDLLLVKKTTSTSWALILMSNINLESCKTLQAKGINKNALLTSIQIASENLVDLYEGAVLGRHDSEVLKRRQNIAYPNGGPIKPNKFESEAPAGKYVVDDDLDQCGTKFTDMMNEIESLKAKLEDIKGQYNKFYSNVYDSTSLTELKSYGKRLAGVPEKSVPCSETEPQMCFSEVHGNILLEAKKITKNTLDWLEFIAETQKDEPEIDIRFLDEEK